jgi:archaellin
VANNTASRGFSAIEVAIFMIAATVVATISAVGLMTLSGDAAQAGVQAADRGLNEATGSVELRGPVIATTGNIDIDGNNVIDLAGNDIEAVASLKLLISADLAAGIDLTPPYTIDDTSIDPDFVTDQNRTVVSVITDGFNVPSAAWSVSFPGDDDGDLVLERGERAEVTIWLHTLDVANGWYDLGAGVADPYVDTEAQALVAKGRFTVRITADEAPETAIQRTLPIELTPSIVLD